MFKPESYHPAKLGLQHFVRILRQRGYKFSYKDRRIYTHALRQIDSFASGKANAISERADDQPRSGSSPSPCETSR